VVGYVGDDVYVVVAVVTEMPGLTGYKLQTVLREAGASYQRGGEVKAAKLAVERGQLIAEKGPRNSTKYLGATVLRFPCTGLIIAPTPGLPGAQSWARAPTAPPSLHPAPRTAPQGREPAKSLS